MRIYFDTEFIERGHEHPIELISIGLVREDDKKLYAVLADGWNADHASEWVRENVFPNLGSREPRVTRANLAQMIRVFAGDSPEFWAYYADYDWVIFCQLFGAMIDLPEGWPMFCRDIKQMCVDLGNPAMPKYDRGVEHNALDDAIETKLRHEFLLKLKYGGGHGGGQT